MKLITLLSCLFIISLNAIEKPNIVWICIEDASCHIGPYGETAIKTPTLDRLASEGIKFDHAFVTAPVCSTSRSAMVTGMYQMTAGIHQHRSQRQSGKGGGNKNFFKSYKFNFLTIPELFKKAGYYTANITKEDYNFIKNDKMYDGTDRNWTNRKKGQPFFVQYQLRGGKFRGSTKGVDQSKIKIPPYYIDDKVIRKDWATYLGSWVKTDEDIEKIISKLRKEGELEKSYIFIWTDHGVSHIRGKQFLYDEGMQVPLIVRFPNKLKAGTVRKDLVKHIDIPVSSLALAGIKIPNYMHGLNIFSEDYNEQEKIYSGRDRCDETVDFMRCVRTKKWKYIRNFLHDVSHMQPSQYKDGKTIVSHSRKLYKEGKLNKVQAMAFQSTRAIEELYDLENDPHEINNLASDSKYKNVLVELRQDLKSWMLEYNKVNLRERIAQLAKRKYPFGGPQYEVIIDSLGKDSYKFFNAKKGSEKISDRKTENEIKQIAKQALSEYYLYTIEGKETIPNRWAKRLPSFDISEIPVVNFYKFEENRYGKRAVRFLSFKNDKAHKLGQTPIPQGNIRVYRNVSDNKHLAYEGASKFKYIPVDQKVELNLGQVQDVIVEPKLMNYQRNEYIYDKHGNVSGWHERKTYQMTVKNTRDVKIKIEIKRNFKDQYWELNKEGDFGKYKKVDLDTVSFELELEPRSQKVFSYTHVQYEGEWRKSK